MITQDNREVTVIIIMNRCGSLDDELASHLLLVFLPAGVHPDMSFKSRKGVIRDRASIILSVKRPSLGFVGCIITSCLNGAAHPSSPDIEQYYIILTNSLLLCTVPMSKYS